MPSPRLSDWFEDWLERHLQRHPSAGLPDPRTNTIYYDAWRNELRRRGVHERDVAEEASERLMAKKHYPSDHFSSLVEFAVKIYAERRQAGDLDAPLGESTIEEVRRRCRDCEWCGGQGLAPVHLRANREDDRTPRCVAATCVCAAGMATRRLYSADLARRTPLLADALEGRGAWRADDPRLDDYTPDAETMAIFAHAPRLRALLAGSFRTPV